MIQTFNYPFEGLFNLQKALDAFRMSNWLSSSVSNSNTYPLLNIFRQKDYFLIVTELSGVQREDIEIQIRENLIRLSGKKLINYEDGISLHRRERSEGYFDRTITLPITIDSSQARAEYRNGILTIFLPQIEYEKARTVTIS